MPAPVPAFVVLTPVPNIACTALGPSINSVRLVLVLLASPSQFMNVQPVAAVAFNSADDKPVPASVSKVTVMLPAPGVVALSVLIGAEGRKCEVQFLIGHVCRLV